MLRSLLFCALDFVLFCAAIYAVDTGYWRRSRAQQGVSGSEGAAVVGMDEDQRRLNATIPAVQGACPEERPQHAVHAQRLSKRFGLQGGGAVQAVRHCSLGVRPDSILGLLGPNGAGKTTMISMLSGVETIDSGEAWINGASVRGDLDTARRHLGLCPQFDALLGMLTAREHLRLFAARPAAKPRLVRYGAHS